MKNQQHLYISMLLATTALLAASLACNIDASEAIAITFEHSYSIDPPSLLRSIGQNGDTPFLPVENRPELPPPTQQIPVDWKQADYFRIVDAIFVDIWGETTDGWLLKSVSFALGCTKIDNGFQNAHFRYFRNEKTQEQEIRIERSVHIDPRSKSVYVLEYRYSPRLVDWGSIDIAQVRFSADNALMIAESNGGQEKRSAVRNVCDISLLLSPDSPRFRGWHVLYSSREDSKLLRVEIDPISGEILFP